MKTFAALTILLTLAACASIPPEWVKTGVGKEDTYTQLSECRYQVGLAKVASSEREQMVAHCMRGKGFRLLAADR